MYVKGSPGDTKHSTTCYFVSLIRINKLYLSTTELSFNHNHLGQTFPERETFQRAIILNGLQIKRIYKETKLRKIKIHMW